MKYISTRAASGASAERKSFCEILLEGLAPDGGLYLDRRAYEDHLSAQKTVGKWALLLVGLSSLIGILLLLAHKL